MAFFLYAGIDNDYNLRINGGKNMKILKLMAFVALVGCSLAIIADGAGAIKVLKAFTAAAKRRANEGDIAEAKRILKNVQQQADDLLNQHAKLALTNDQIIAISNIQTEAFTLERSLVSTSAMAMSQGELNKLEKLTDSLERARKGKILTDKAIKANAEWAQERKAYWNQLMEKAKAANTPEKQSQFNKELNEYEDAIHAEYKRAGGAAGATAGESKRLIETTDAIIAIRKAIPQLR
jgi:hypothetical protein